MKRRIFLKATLAASTLLACCCVSVNAQEKGPASELAQKFESGNVVGESNSIAAQINLERSARLKAQKLLQEEKIDAAVNLLSSSVKKYPHNYQIAYLYAAALERKALLKFNHDIESSINRLL